MVSERLKHAVKEKDISSVREEIIGIINVNPSLSDGSFQEELKYAENHLGEALYEKYDGNFSIVEDKKQWDSKYVAKIYFGLRKNFSKKLIRHLMEVAPVVFESQGIENKKKQKSGMLPQEQKKEGKQDILLLIVVIVIILVIILLILL